VGDNGIYDQFLTLCHAGEMVRLRTLTALASHGDGTALPRSCRASLTLAGAIGRVAGLADSEAYDSSAERMLSLLHIQAPDWLAFLESMRLTVESFIPSA
jgi:hypothetical protein